VMMGTLATTLGPLPGGVGTFEAAAVSTLVMLAVPTEEALAGILLLRGLTFWAPMLPGLAVVRAELKGRRPVSDLEREGVELGAHPVDGVQGQRPVGHRDVHEVADGLGEGREPGLTDRTGPRPTASGDDVGHAV
jgi:hypothetical protein